jgi:hypothetical protein
MNKPEDQPTTTPPPLSPPLKDDAPLLSIFEHLLKHPFSLVDNIRTNEKPGGLILKLSLVIVASLLLFGITLGSFSFHEQLWAAPVKTLFGVLFSAVICLPSLYIFTSLTGTSLKLIEIVQGLASALALTGALLLGFAPVLWVFSQSSESQPFFGFLVIATWLISVLFGTGFLMKMLKGSGTENSGPVKIWVGIFLLVTLQMSTTLRPLIGRSDTFLTTQKRFFLQHWGEEMSPNREEYREVEEGR